MKQQECSICGGPIDGAKYQGAQNCGKCGRYCYQNCKLASSTFTSWHKEPCVSCERNPYKALHSWDGEKWVRR